MGDKAKKKAASKENKPAEATLVETRIGADLALDVVPAKIAP